MRPIDITILTDQNNLIKSVSSRESSTGYIEDALLQKAFEDSGLTVMRKAWDDPLFDWSTTRLIIFRSTWDYFYRFNEFNSWLDKVSQQTQLINSSKLIQWNVDKHYLKDLENNGVHIVESHFIEQGTTSTLSQIHNKLGWNKTVLKPCISGTARHTYVIDQSNINDYELEFKGLIKNESFLLQPFQESILSRGEVSIIIINGHFTHAILKLAKFGDFRVQGDFGGTYTSYQPTPQEIKFAEKTIKACNEQPVYARVDIITDNSGNIALTELELVEPELWFRENNNAAKLLSKAIKSIYF